MHVCELCRTRMLHLQAPTEWEWFTGKFDRTLAFCPACRRKHATNIGRLLTAAYGNTAQDKLSADAAVELIFGPRRPA